ncbi:MAG: capsule assembly Wzi family protein [Rhodothalassiaceae bacterium]
MTLALLAAPAVARSPWIDPGDRLIRHDVELLKAYGLIDGPITTWPISWKHVERSLAAIQDRTRLPAHVQAAIARLTAQSIGEVAPDAAEAYLQLQLTNEERLVRDFSGGARDEVDARVILDKLFERGYLRVSVGYREDEADDDINFDGTVAGLTLGNWLIFAGFQDQWFGPGFDSALILSTNARPAPRLSLQRLDPKRIDFPVLRWLGPLQVNFTAALGESGRDDFDTPALFWTRFSFEPLQGFQIGVSRGLMLCGQGRVCNAESFGRAFVTVADFIFQVGGDLDNTGEVLTDPGNQVAGLDFRYTGYAGAVSYTGYAEIASEDSSGPVAIGDVSITLGASLGGYWKRRQLNWTLRGEASDTQSNRFFGINAPGQPGSANQNFIFTDGYSFRDRFIGPSIGGDGRLYTGEFSVVDADSRLYFARYRHVVLNATGLTPTPTTFDRIAFNTLASDTPERINMLEFGLLLPPSRFGRFFFEGRVMDDQANTPGRDDFGGAVELGWTFRF